MKALRIGLTGGIGAGKSLALAALSRWGAEVVDADEIARAQARPGGKAYRRIMKEFGTADRRRLGELVFSDPRARRKLERITHPFVKDEMSRRLRAATHFVFVAVPLLFEAGLENQFDVTVAIEAPEAVRRRRVARRDGLTAARVGARMKAQFSERARRARADIVIRNDGDKRKFLASVRDYYRAFALLRHGAAAR